MWTASGRFVKFRSRRGKASGGDYRAPASQPALLCPGKPRPRPVARYAAGEGPALEQQIRASPPVVVQFEK